MAKLYFRVEAEYQKVIKLREECAKLEEQLKGMNSSSSQSYIKRLEKELAEARAELRRMEAEAATAGARIERDIRAKAKGAAESVDALTASFKKAVGVIGGATALKQLASQIVRVRGEFQEMETTIETMVGKNMAGKLLPQLKELAKISPLTMSDIVGAEQMMLGFNIAAEDTMKYLKALSDLSMGSSTKFNSLTLAFSQMSAAGKLMGQDLNQMIGQGFNPLQVISEKTGKSIAVLKDEMSKGAISAEMVQEAFISATEAGGKFYKMSENASKTINGQMSMMQDAMDNAFNEMGKASEGFIIKSISLTTSLVQNYETIGKALAGLIATYGVYKTAVLTNIALEKVQVVARLASIRQTSLLSASIGLLTKKMAALNIVSSMNPYGLVAAALMAMAAAAWMFHDSTTAAEKAQKNFNDELERFKKNEDDRKDKIEKLVTIIKDKNETEFAQVRAYEELKKLSPALTSAYTREQIATENLANAQKELNKERDKNEHQNIISSISNLEKKIKYLKELRENLHSMPNTGGVIDTYSSKIEESEEELKKWKGELKKYNDLKKKAEEDSKPIEVKVMEAKADLQQIEDEFAAAEKKLEEEKAKLKQNPVYQIPFYVRLDYDNKRAERDSKKKRLSVLEEEQNKKPNWYGEAYKAAEKKWKEAKKNLREVEKDKDKFTVEIYNKRKEALENASAAFKTLGGDVSDKADEAYKDAAKRQKESLEALKKIDELEKKHREGLSALYADAENKAEKARIDAMEDGYEKVAALQNYNNKLELENIEKQKEAYIQKVTKAQKEIFEAREKLKEEENSKYKAKEFDPGSADIDVSAFDSMSADVIRRQNAEKIKAQKDAWNEYYKAYGDFQQKRRAIMESYGDKIAEAATDGEKALLRKQMADELDELDERMKGSATLMGKLFADASQMSINEIDKVIGRVELLMDYLASNKDEQGNADINGKNVSRGDIIELGISSNSLDNLEKSPEKIKAIGDALKGLKGELSGRSPWKKFTKDMNEAFDTFKDAKGKKGKDKTAAIGDGISKIGKSIVEFTPAIQEFGDNLGNILGNDKFASTADDIAAAIGGLGQTAAGVGQIMSGDIIGGAMSAVSGISSMVTAFGSLFSGSNEMEVKETIERLTMKNDRLIESLDELTETMQKESGAKAIEAYEKAEQIQKEINKNLLAQAKAQSRRHGEHHSWDYYFDFNPDDIRWIQENVSKSFKGKEDLWSLTPEQMKKLRENVDLWYRMQQAGKDDYGKDVIDKLDDYADQAGKLEELFDNLNEAITGISFDSFKEGFVDALSDMESSSKDFAERFEEQMRNAVFRSVIDNEFEGEIKKLYDKWYKAANDGLTKEEAKNLRKDQQGLVEEMLARREELMKDFGWSSKDPYSQEASSKGFNAMSQEVGNELNGRFTALNESSLRQESLLGELLTVMKEGIGITDVRGGLTVRMDTSALQNIAEDTRNIMVDSYLELQQIRENTGAIVKPIKQMQADIAEVKRNTERL